MRYSLGVVVLIVGCGRSPATVSDAEVPVDVTTDSPVDASPDAPIDAPPISLSPTCTTTPTILVDVAPHRIGNIAVTGDVLHVSSYDLESGPGDHGRVVSIDLTTETPVSAPLETVGAAWLQYGTGSVYGTDPRGGTIWKFEAGAAPVPLVTGRSAPRTATGDTTHVYWAEESGVVYRRLLSGGTIEPVMTCEDARNLIVDGNDLYCAPFAQNVYRGPKAGGAPAVAIASVQSLIVTMIQLGNSLFVANLHGNPQLYSVSMPDGPATLVKQITGPDRFEGMTATSDYFYLTDSNEGVRRIHRVTNVDDVIYSGPFAAQDPVVWNNQLYFAKRDSFVMHCVD